MKKCVELANEDSDHEEVWILKIPKSVDVTELVGAKINLDACEPIKKTNLDFYSERNKTNRTMSLITPRKLAGSEIVSDSLRLIKPVGFARVKRTIPTIYPYDIDDLELPEAEVRPVLTNKKKKSSPTKKLNEPIAKNSSREEVARKSKRKNDCSSGEESNQPKAKKIKLPKPIKIKKEKTDSSDELSWLKDVLK